MDKKNFTRDEFFKLFASNEAEILKNFFRYLEFKSISSEPEYMNELLACADWLKNDLAQAGFKTELLDTGRCPVVYAEWLKAGADKPTVLLYGHYDVQPVDPLELWNSPPFTPTVKDGTVFARGAQDNKGQSYYVVSVLKELLKRDGSLPVNVKLCIEGEEEIGSPGLAKNLENFKDKLKADHLLIVDFGIHDMDHPAVTCGMRGIVTMNVKVSGSKTDLHSGSHGGVAYNPNHALVELLASLRDPQGKITLPGFYDNVADVSNDIKEKISFSFSDEEYEALFGAKPTGGEKNFTPQESCWLRPTLEINGISGGYSGQGFKTVIPAEAQAKVSCRLVPNQDPIEIGNLIKSHLESRAPEGICVSVEVLPGVGLPVRTSFDSRVVKATADAYSDITQKQAGFIFEGASVPIVAGLKKVSGAEVVMLGYALPTDLIHAPNEHFGLDRFKLGFATIGKILANLA